MTIREAAKGVFLRPSSGKGSYNVGFNGGDETQFDVKNLSELEECWKGFCKDEGCAENSVDYVERA